MPLTTAAAALAAAVLAGCAASAGSTGTSLRSPLEQLARHHHHGSYYAPRSRAAGGGPLPSSSTTVQPQPPAASCNARGNGVLVLPDPSCTPGATNPAVTQATIANTICRTGWTRTVRPPESVTGPEKRASLAAYGDQGALSGYEYDHLVPLEVGGAPNDPRNLWPEPQAGPPPNIKDKLENRAKALVCRGQVPLAEAQRAIATDWVSAYRRYVGSAP
jgi:hypothetical protein